MLRRLMMAGSGSSATDPYWSNVASLIHFDGADGSNLINDQKGISWVANGDAELSASVKKFGTASLDNTGSSSWVYSSSSPGINLNQTSLTVEMWIRAASTPDGSALLCNEYSGASDRLPLVIGFCDGVVGSAGGNKLFVGSYVAPWQGFASTFAPSIGVWHHIAAVKSSSTVSLFVDGVKLGQYSSSSVTSSRQMLIGRRWDSISSMAGFDGYIDDFRATMGVARYTSNFTPPAAPFPDA